MKYIVGTEQIDLEVTLMESAQCFHWLEREGRFGAVLDGASVWLWRESGQIVAEGGDRERLRDYLDLNRDYALALNGCGACPQAAEALRTFSGLRVLNQPPWEALVAFILSANNNVSRIKALVRGVCRAYGPRADGLFGFPAPGALADASEAALRALGMGYRAPYIRETARRVAEGFPLESLRDMPYDEAHALLLTLPGVGDKVADCALLFGCRHAEAFPVDVWVERLMAQWYGVVCKNRRDVALRARDMLGENCGLLQQALFHAARTGAIELTK